MRIKNITAGIHHYLILLVSMGGFVPKHASLPRVITIGGSIVFSTGLGWLLPHNATAGLIYFVISEFLYLGFIFLVLSEIGIRQKFIQRFDNEQDAYLVFEAILGFLFFHNAAGLSYLSSSTAGNTLSFIARELVVTLALLMGLTGFIIKIWSAKVVSIDIYYWKDMFLGKKITEFVETGPYKFLVNPMYGIGQLMPYAFALWYGSWPGFLAAFINQCLIFTFYFTVEKKFIRRVYLGG